MALSWKAASVSFSGLHYRAEVVNYPDSYFLSPKPPPPSFTPSSPHHYCLPDEWLWSAKHARLTLNCENNAPVVVLTFPMLPHLNRPGYGFHRFQGKTHFQSKQRSQPSLGNCRDSRHSHSLLRILSMHSHTSLCPLRSFMIKDFTQSI